MLQNNIKRIRQSKNISQKELAELCNISQMAIFEYEIGKIKLNDNNHSDKIAKILGVSLEALLITSNDTLKQLDLDLIKDEILKEMDDLNQEDLKNILEYVSFFKWKKIELNEF